MLSFKFVSSLLFWNNSIKFNFFYIFDKFNFVILLILLNIYFFFFGVIAEGAGMERAPCVDHHITDAIEDKALVNKRLKRGVHLTEIGSHRRRRASATLVGWRGGVTRAAPAPAGYHQSQYRENQYVTRHENRKNAHESLTMIENRSSFIRVASSTCPAPTA